MRQLFTILCLLLTFTAMAQRKYKGVVQTTAEGYGHKTLTVDTALGLPRYDHKLDTSVVKYLGRKGDALIFTDTLHGILYWYNPHTGIVDTINKAGGGGIEGWLQRMIDNNPLLDKSNKIIYPNLSLTLLGDTTVIAGEGVGGSITTKFGVISDSNTYSGAAATTMGFPVIRSGMTYGSGFYPFELQALTYPSKEVHVVVNFLKNDSTQAYPDSAAIDNYIVEFSGIIDQHFAPHSIFYIAVQNEPFNNTYYRLNESSARRYAYLLQRVGGLFKRKNLRYFISDGGITGPVMDWFVLHYLDSTGQTTVYNNYKRQRFTTSQQATVDNWDVTGPYVETIARYREYFSYLQDMDSVDGTSLHYPLSINDSTDIDTSLICAAVEAYSFYSGGKEVVFNEVGFRNQSTAIPPKVMAKADNLGIKYWIWYNGPDSTFSGKNNYFTNVNGTALRTNGTALKTQFSSLSGAIRHIMEWYKDGRIRIPGMPNVQVLGTNANSEIIASSVSGGGTTGNYHLPYTGDSTDYLGGDSLLHHLANTIIDGGDTTIYASVLDSTGNTNNKVIVAKNGKLSSDTHFLWNFTTDKLSIGTNNGARGGSVKLYVEGNAMASAFIRNGGAANQFLKADGSVDTSVYAKSVRVNGTNHLPDAVTGVVDLGTLSSGSIDTGRGVSQIATGGSLNKVRDSVQNNIPTNNTQLTNGSNFIARSGLSVTAGKPLTYNSTTGNFDFDTTNHHSKQYYDGIYSPINANILNQYASRQTAKAWFDSSKTNKTTTDTALIGTGTIGNVLDYSPFMMDSASSTTAKGGFRMFNGINGTRRYFSAGWRDSSTFVMNLVANNPVGTGKAMKTLIIGDSTQGALELYGGNGTANNAPSSIKFTTFSGIQITSGGAYISTTSGFKSNNVMIGLADRTIQYGQLDNAATGAAGGTGKIWGESAGVNTSNLAGGDLELRAGLGGGTANGGSINFKTAAPFGVSGTTYGTATTKFTIDVNGNLTTPNGVNAGGTVVSGVVVTGTGGTNKYLQTVIGGVTYYIALSTTLPN